MLNIDRWIDKAAAGTEILLYVFYISVFLVVIRMKGKNVMLFIKIKPN